MLTCREVLARLAKAVFKLGCKVLECHMGCHIRISYGYLDTNKKNKLQNPLVNHETNLLSLINLLLTHVYCSTLLSNHGLIRLKRFVSQNSRKLCN